MQQPGHSVQLMNQITVHFFLTILQVITSCLQLLEKNPQALELLVPNHSAQYICQNYSSYD